MEMPSPSGDELKAARVAADLSQVEAAQLMGYPVQAGSRGGLQSRTWQALESSTDPRNMPGPIFAMFQLLTGQHPQLKLVPTIAAPGFNPDVCGVADPGCANTDT
jgi:hypothetical protein